MILTIIKDYLNQYTINYHIIKQKNTDFTRTATLLTIIQLSNSRLFFKSISTNSVNIAFSLFQNQRAKDKHCRNPIQNTYLTLFYPVQRNLFYFLERSAIIKSSINRNLQMKYLNFLYFSRLLEPHIVK